MSRLTVRLPETLHQQLTHLAESEGISLNQYIVYALTRQVVLAYTVQATPIESVDQQQQAFQTLLKELGQASSIAAQSVLDQRETVQPEPELSPEIIALFQERIRAASHP
ncbi:MAG: toxin-antitoxin system HicB family antitoxin [Cyanobacteria bacterium RI_101]|nr:toxin-antitoxin system HicB family antitoxin [Cyanobacteria bacterium RI_101]